MTKKEKTELEEYLTKLINKYTKILLLDKHTFELHYGVENKDSLMECVFNYPYLNVTIKYSDKLVEMWRNKKDITPYLVHEMCHPITDPLYSKAISRYVSRDEILDEREKLPEYIKMGDYPDIESKGYNRAIDEFLSTLNKYRV